MSTVNNMEQVKQAGWKKQSSILVVLPKGFLNSPQESIYSILT